MDIWGKNIPDRKDSKYKGPAVSKTEMLEDTQEYHAAGGVSKREVTEEEARQLITYGGSCETFCL